MPYGDSQSLKPHVGRAERVRGPGKRRVFCDVPGHGSGISASTMPR
jgi:hypothetical protein